MKALLLNLGPIILACAIFGTINYKLGGGKLLLSGATAGGKFFLGIVPLIVFFAILSGQIQVLCKAKEESVKSMTAGKRGVVLAATAGAMIPSAMSAGATVQKEWNNGGNKYAIIAFLIASTLLNWNAFLFRLPFFGWRLTLITFLSCTVLASVMVFGLMAAQHFRSTQ